MLCCGYTLTDFPISIRLISLALWQSNDCPSASKATLMNMDKYFMWIHYERLHNHNKAKHNKTVCIFLGIYCKMFGVVLTNKKHIYGPSGELWAVFVTFVQIVQWWRHQMEAFSVLLALSEGNTPVTGGFPSQRPVTRSFDVFFDLSRNKRLSQQLRRPRFETPLWRHCNDPRNIDTLPFLHSAGCLHGETLVFF